MFLGASFTYAQTQNQVGLWYTGANPDYKPFKTKHGLALTYERAFRQDYFARLYFNETDFTASGPEVGFENITSWTELGFGVEHDILPGLYSYYSYTDVQSEDTSFDGFGIHVGYRWHWNQEWHSLIQVGHLDTGFSDIQLIGKLNYQFHPSASFSLAIKDHADWDLTSYEAGVVYRF
jgi:hypothetical protein